MTRVRAVVLGRATMGRATMGNATMGWATAPGTKARRSGLSLSARLAITPLVLLGLAACASLPPGSMSGTAPAGTTATTPSIPDGKVRDGILARWSVEKLDSRLDASVDKGRVLLTGRARTPDERVDAVRLAWQADGALEVINEIQIDDKSGLSDQATDTWITTQLRYKLLTDAEITSRNFTIDVVNQTVYLLGRARSQQELDRVLAHARGLARVQRVVSHVRV